MTLTLVSTDTTIRYLSMFSGIGGFELGIGYAALSLGLRAECVGYSEIDRHAITTYEEHFDHTNYGDATTLDADTLPDFDLLVGGFPCQSFSLAGKRRGFDDVRGTLFFDIARVLRAKRPRHFVLENVRGLLSHQNGLTFQTIVGILTDLGYCVEWQVLNSKDFGVPQNRERIYFVGHYGGQPSTPVFPLTRDAIEFMGHPEEGATPADRVHGGAGRDPKSYALPAELVAGIDSTDVRAHFDATGDPAVGVTREARGAGGDRFNVRPVAGNINATAGTGLDRRSQRSAIAYNPKLAVIRNKKDGKVTYSQRDTANCIDASYHKGLDYHGQRTGIANVSGDHLMVRRLTPVETERLQGFPDGWTLGSDTQRYRQCGNAVTVNVVESVVGRLYAQVSN